MRKKFRATYLNAAKTYKDKKPNRRRVRNGRRDFQKSKYLISCILPSLPLSHFLEVPSSKKKRTGGWGRGERGARGEKPVGGGGMSTFWRIVVFPPPPKGFPLANRRHIPKEVSETAFNTQTPSQSNNPAKRSPLISQRPKSCQIRTPYPRRNFTSKKVGSAPY